MTHCKNYFLEDFLVDSIFREAFATPRSIKDSLRLSVPGYSKEEIKISTENQTLQVEGRREKDSPYGEDAFASIYPLDRAVDVEKIEAKLEHGVLSVSLPQLESAKAKIVHVT